MPKNVHVTDEVTLEGFQAILEPGKFGYSLSAVVSEDLADKLENERTEVLRWARVCKPIHLGFCATYGKQMLSNLKYHLFLTASLIIRA